MSAVPDFVHASGPDAAESCEIEFSEVLRRLSDDHIVQLAKFVGGASSLTWAYAIQVVIYEERTAHFVGSLLGVKVCEYNAWRGSLPESDRDEIESIVTDSLGIVWPPALCEALAIRMRGMATGAFLSE